MDRSLVSVGEGGACKPRKACVKLRSCLIGPLASKHSGFASNQRMAGRHNLDLAFVVAQPGPTAPRALVASGRLEALGCRHWQALFLASDYPYWPAL